MIFDNNDRPGILLSSAIKRYSDLFGVACGEKNILFTNNDSAYETAISLIQKGINVEAIIDNREEIDSKLIYDVEKNNVKIFKGYTVAYTIIKIRLWAPQYLKISLCNISITICVFKTWPSNIVIPFVTS